MPRSRVLTDATVDALCSWARESSSEMSPLSPLSAGQMLQ
jgi:hypothetical protein